jgi:hypothetical protein
LRLEKQGVLGVISLCAATGDTITKLNNQASNKADAQPIAVWRRCTRRGFQQMIEWDCLSMIA